MTTSLDLLRVAVGRPRVLVDADGREWTTAFARSAVTLPWTVDESGLAGDASQNRRYHHGPDCAVCVFPAAHFAMLGAALGLAMGPGDAGENLTVGGADEGSVCIGDRFGAGEVEFEVSEPRVPCGTFARYHARPQLVRMVRESGATGWFLRVARGGVLDTATLALRARPHPHWTVARVNRLRHQLAEGPEAVAEACALAALSASWRSWFAQHRG